MKILNFNNIFKYFSLPKKSKLFNKKKLNLQFLLYLIS